ncbi:MAG: carbohydrate kinase family protein [Candidatus Paceibacterota bacterium]
MFDVVTFGSATLDMSLLISKANIEKDEKSVAKEAYCFNLGSKIDIFSVYFSLGGGGINTATTFKKQGFKTAYCGTIGDDIFGEQIIKYLKEQKINFDLVKKTKLKQTNNSVILDNPNYDRTILVYRGASELLVKQDFFSKIKTKWFYLAPLSGELSKMTQVIISCAKKNNAKIVANFGNSQIKSAEKEIKQWLAQIDVLILNQEEASLLTGIDYNNEEKIIKKLNLIHSGINIMTKGEQGVTVTANNKIYKAKTKSFKVIDETGAGDAFGSGFVSALMRNEKIEDCIRLGLANSKYALKEQGAVSGVLSKKDNYLVKKENIKVQIENFN